MNHSFQDAVSFEMARRIAQALPEHPEWLDTARANLERWKARNKSTPSLLQCDEEWVEILARPIQEICTILTADTDEGQRLRQNTPFVGILTPQEVWKIKARHRHGTSAT